MERGKTVDAGQRTQGGEFGVSAPQISLPKGGGAIHGIGEKFSANSVTGTGSMSVPIATSPGRAGFGPQLALTYDSGAGNGPFGFGWHLAIPAITRKTDKGLPQYRDAEESDVFVLSGAEDLTPAFRKNEASVLDTERRAGYLVTRYRPRVEGLFARIERWTRQCDGDTHWRSISKDNVLTVYGATAESRIADPADLCHVFSWLICQSYDDRGNAISYEYAAENQDNVDPRRVNERNRVRTANRYLKAIRYGNRLPLLIDATQPGFRQCHVPAPDLSRADWMFEVLFDYGEGHYAETPPDPDGRTFATATLDNAGKWPARLDPFSTYRSGFEVRSYRLCRRVLMFHHFPAELGVDDYLVRSTEFVYREQPNGSFMAKVLQSGFKRIALPTPRYLKRSLPPLEFEYSKSPLDELTFERIPLREVDQESLQSLAGGVDGRRYRWVDLNGEGIAGVLSEQADAWFYEPNLGEGRFGPVENVAARPSLAALGRGHQQLLDLAGDGNLDLVDFGAPAPGFFSRDEDAAWRGFRSFENLPNINWQDPNLRFVDLTGDGHADVLITGDDVFFTWHASRAEQGFGAANCVSVPLDEERGPRIVFADGTQSIFLADMSGDGQTDLVRIRNGEVCYWPNIGYGRFGSKVTLDNSPWFEEDGLFDQSRIHLADIDGSGPSDIVYLGRGGIRVYLNQHGNSLSDARLIDRVPRTDHLTSVAVVDFLGRGTACLLWSSPLPGDERRPLRYLDLMDGIKPHLLTSVRNNLGAETHIEYASSTRFYLEDKKAGAPWVTRLPFPVHVVTRVETRDLISGNRFATRYTYHHGYFDGIEREFRGFGRVEQMDTEEFGVLVEGGPATNLERAFHVPPVLTKTWFHTGAYLAGARISRHLEHEYYREDDASGSDGLLLDDTVLPQGLGLGETREAIRALKGAILRQEVYALDDKPESARPYSVSERNYTVKPLQPRGANRYAVFFTHARESIDFNYERKLFPVLHGAIVDSSTAAGNPDVAWRADPRVTHSVTLDVDDYGNVRRSVAVGYGRRFDDADPILTDADRSQQKRILATMSEATFTNAVQADDAYRVPLAAEARTYELLELAPARQQRAMTNLFRFDELRSMVAAASDGQHEVAYEDFEASAKGEGPRRRLIEEQRTRYRSDRLDELLPLNSLQALAVQGESYKLAFTSGLLAKIYRRSGAAGDENLLPDPGAVLPSDGAPESDRGGYVDLDGDGRWWVPSGRAFCHVDENASEPAELDEAVRHFFLPRRYRNAFGQSALVDYAHDLLACRSRDAVGNVVEAQFDFRVLQAKQVTDPNGNRSFVMFDGTGLPVATAARGKTDESLGDSLDDFGDFDADPTLAQLQAFVSDPAARKSSLLKSATSRFVYDVDRYARCGEPALAATIARETHVSDARPGQDVKIQLSFGYSDGFGRELQSKTPAEPGAAPTRGSTTVLPDGDTRVGALVVSAGELAVGDTNSRWVGKGRIVYNNKGNPVKQYEPFFSSTHLYEPEPEMADTGVTSIVFYDPAARIVATLHPNHTYEKVVFDPWRHETWDVNDTVSVPDPAQDPDVGEYFQALPAPEYMPTWYRQRIAGQKGQHEEKAAQKAAAHAATPAVAFFDTLGRPFVRIADNGRDSRGVAQRHASRVVVDIGGNARAIRDSLDRIAVRYDHDLCGDLVHQASMEAGERWIVSDISGNPIRVWDSRGNSFRIQYDALRRSRRSFVMGAFAADVTIENCFEQLIYGETSGSGLTPDQVLRANLRGRTHMYFDTAGVVTSHAYDFKGNLLRSSRRFVQGHGSPIDWSTSEAPDLESESYASTTRYDALNRPVQMIAPRSSRPSAGTHVIQPGYNAANLLERVDVWLCDADEPSGLVDPKTASLHPIIGIEYDAKSQRTQIRYGNGTVTHYAYDRNTFRLVRLVSASRGRQAVQDLTYFYDPVGNITRIGDGSQQTHYFKGQVVQPDCDYTYDATYRLVMATGREHIGQLMQQPSVWTDALRIGLQQPGDGTAMRNYIEHYLYDAAGNFQKLTHQAVNGSWTRIYRYAEASLIEANRHSNRLTAISSGQTSESFRHDQHGNTVGMSHLTAMQWDFRDQLSVTSQRAIRAEQDAAAAAERTLYAYSSSGERVRKTTERVGGVRRSERIYLGGCEIYREFTANGQDVVFERETLEIKDDSLRIALVDTRTRGDDGSPPQLIRYQLSNHLASACLELDENAGIISFEEYYPHGGTSYQAVDRRIKAAAKRYRWAGKERDEETGLTYHGARYYSPWIGIWISCDPIGLSDSENLYTYSRNNPICLSDPTGCVSAAAQREIDANRHDDSRMTPDQIGDAYKETYDVPKDLSTERAISPERAEQMDLRVLQGESKLKQEKTETKPLTKAIVKERREADFKAAQLGMWNAAVDISLGTTAINFVPGAVDSIKAAKPAQTGDKVRDLNLRESYEGGEIVTHTVVIAVSLLPVGEMIQGARLAASKAPALTGTGSLGGGELIGFSEQWAAGASEAGAGSRLSTIGEPKAVTAFEQAALDEGAAVFEATDSPSAAGTAAHDALGAPRVGPDKSYPGFVGEYKTHWYGMMTEEQLKSATVSNFRHAQKYVRENNGLFPIRKVDHFYWRKNGPAVKYTTH